jgi:DNA-binding PadR family transcriptional regulator
VKLTINEEIYLIAIWHLKGDAYGVKIREKIKDLTGNWVLLGTLYNTLNQLIKKNYVVTRKGEPTFQRGGHNKVYYSITQEGEQALKNIHELQEKLWSDIPHGVFEG